MKELERLIQEPDETLEVEYKDWLDLKTKAHKAKLAKELIALANHGGGHVVLGFEDETLEPTPKPADYGYVNTDYINGIVAKYADPAFHCSVAVVLNHVVVGVPAGTKVPIKSLRGSENDEILQNAYYTRRPGPNSEQPQNGLEWDQLLRRCMTNRDAEMEAMVRKVLSVLENITEESPKKPVDAIEELLQ